MISYDELLSLLRRRAREGATMVELVDLVHELTDTPPYARGCVGLPFAHAFRLKPADFSNFVFACVLFGDGATMSVAEAERMFRIRMSELGFAPS